jgi:hypothetical protein
MAVGQVLYSKVAKVANPGATPFGNLGAHFGNLEKVQ